MSVGSTGACSSGESHDGRTSPGAGLPPLGRTRLFEQAGLAGSNLLHLRDARQLPMTSRRPPAIE